MSFCIICFLHGFRRPNPEQHHILSDLTAELEDSRKFTLNSLMALLAILAVSGSKALQPVVLMLLIYTISLRLAINVCFLRDFPTLSRFLHVLPLLGTSCMAGAALVSNSQSPVFASIGLVLGVLPLVTIAIHHGRLCGDTSAAGLPVQMQAVPVAAALGSGDVTPVSS